MEDGNQLPQDPQDDVASDVENEEENAMDNADQFLIQVLLWIGFTEQQVAYLVEDSFSSFEDVRDLETKDIRDLADSYQKRTQQNGRIVFGMRRIKRLQHLIYWAQDFYRCSLKPSIEGLTRDEFFRQLHRANERNNVRKQMLQNQSVNTSESSPGKLESEKMWIEWEPKFTNFLSNVLGVSGVPLIYVIRENSEPERTKVFANFMDQCVAQAPLYGELYSADADSVNQYLITFTSGESSETWIKEVVKRKEGRKTMKVLRDHFDGEGNATRRISHGEKLRETLHYLGERKMKFETFLTKAQKMFNIYAKHQEPFTEPAKIRFLFSKIEHPKLQVTVEALKARVSSGEELSYTTITNHLMSAVTLLPEYNSATNRTISGVGQIGSGKIYRADGTINTDNYKDFKSLSKEEKKAVIDERKRLGIRHEFKTSNQVSNSKFKRVTNKLKRKVASLKKQVSFKDDEDKDDPGNDDDDAGNQFGGRESKKRKKNKS